MLADCDYDEVNTRLNEGDCLLLFSDGAFEIHNAQDQMLGIEGLLGILRGFGYPTSSIQMKAVEEELLRFSNGLRLDDDVTFLEVRMN